MEKKGKIESVRTEVYFPLYAYVLISFAMMVGCAPVTDSFVSTPQRANEVPGSTQITPTPVLRELRPVDNLPEMVPTEINPTSPPVTGEVPEDLLAAILADLAERVGVAVGDITVIRGQEIVWSDGSLGCPQPGMMYTQALVSGYWVVLQAGETDYDYRASQTGYFFLCESDSLLQVTPQDEPGSSEK
jgi:hypothetical protein